MEEAVCIQWERVKDKAIRQTFVRKLEKQLERLIVECMDWDLKEPTPAQVSYAALISRKLNISIPSEAEKYRFHMALFIDRLQRTISVGDVQASHIKRSRNGESTGACCGETEIPHLGRQRPVLTAWLK